MKKIIFYCLLGLNANMGVAQEGIIGGDIPEGETYPWMCSTILSVPLTGCGASLIRPQWVLTAGHCELSGFGVSTEKVLINSLNLDLDALESYSELIDVEAFIVHDEYNSVTGVGPDIALIRLSTPSTITPVELADLGDSEYFEHGDIALALGWGLTEGGTDSDMLLATNCRFFSPDTCEALYNESDDSFYDLNVGGNICAGYFEGEAPTGAASGDSGGPLLFVDGEGNYKQVGVVSGGEYELTTEDFPGVFTLVPAYLAWIETTIADYELAASLTAENREKLEIVYFGNQRIEVRGLSEKDQYEIVVFDLMGNQIEWNETSVGMNSYTTTVSGFPSGMYLVQAMNKANGNVTVERFVIN